jgi:adenosylhomocysteinase
MDNAKLKKELKVCARILKQLRNRKYMEGCRLLLLEHILPTTESLVYNLLESGAEIHVIFAKPYSIDNEVYNRLLERKINIQNYSYEDLEKGEYIPNAIKSAVKKSKEDGRKILIYEVGGYFAKFLVRSMNNEYVDYIAGVVEDTTFGHNRYLKLKDQIDVPIISVARSRLKEIEAHFVGRDAVMALDIQMREIGESITGKNAVVIGYGMIGKNVARYLRSADLNVSVYDIRDHRCIKAFMMGFNVNKKIVLIRKADFIFAATGWSSYMKMEQCPALTIDDIIDNVKDNAMLVSVGSKNNEYEIEKLVEVAEDCEEIGTQIKRYTLPNKDKVNVVKDGTAVNFMLPSIPIEILDIVFSEIVLAGILLLKKPDTFPLHTVNCLEERYWDYISKDWLRFNNH